MIMPYFFIADNGTQRHFVGTTFRLIAHPDVTIFLEDKLSGEIDPKTQDASKFTSDYITDSFWTYYGEYGKIKVKSLWSLPVYRHTQLAGQKALESFARIQREDGEEDFGYFSTARGDPNSKEYRPDLRFYVIRQAKHAKDKGIEPIGKEAFLKMAQAIAASVKRRPTTPN